MSTSQRVRFNLGVAFTFYGAKATSKIASRIEGDHLSFEGNVHFTRPFDMFPGTYVEVFCVAHIGHQCHHYICILQISQCDTKNV